MPMGSVRQDLNKTGVSFRQGNPVPASQPYYDSNSIPPGSPDFNSNPVPASDASFNSNVVNWTPTPSYFGNSVNIGEGGGYAYDQGPYGEFPYE